MSTATYLSSTVRQRSQRARVQRLAVAQRLIGLERSVSGLTVGNLAAREPGHRDAGFDYTPRVNQGERLP